MKTSARGVGAAAAVFCLVVALSGAGVPAGASDPAPWQWPIAGARITAPYVAPAHRYSPGHRGIDIAASGGSLASPVAAPTAGTVAFVGRVVDRDVLTLDVGDGTVVSFEPLVSELSAGDQLERGETLGAVDRGGHAATGTLHIGVRIDGEYVNPLRFFGGVPRAVLLPCCE